MILSPIVIKLYIDCITQSYFAVPKNRLNSTFYFIMKIPNKWELQQTAFDCSWDIDFMNLYKKCTGKPY